MVEARILKHPRNMAEVARYVLRRRKAVEDLGRLSEDEIKKRMSYWAHGSIARDAMVAELERRATLEAA